ncbi:hypothetical protein, partial [Escherichia coli]|uniref:hypothetical protein n=1 Tax=Escherichia coli TaxID=562 RepID=UPI001BAEE0E1
HFFLCFFSFLCLLVDKNKHTGGWVENNTESFEGETITEHAVISALLIGRVFMGSEEGTSTGNRTDEPESKPSS